MFIPSALVSSSHVCHCIKDQISESSRDITAHSFWYSIFTFPICCYLSAEEERIRKCRGRVFALRDEPEVARVWLPHNDTPGLAMARAFGDFCLKEFGLISVPEISCRRITEKDEFIVLATDGVRTTLESYLYSTSYSFHSTTVKLFFRRFGTCSRTRRW